MPVHDEFGNKPIELRVEVERPFGRHFAHDAPLELIHRFAPQACDIDNVDGAVVFPCFWRVLPSRVFAVAFGNVEEAVGIGFVAIVIGVASCFFDGYDHVDIGRVERNGAAHVVDGAKRGCGLKQHEAFVVDAAIAVVVERVEQYFVSPAFVGSQLCRTQEWHCQSELPCGDGGYFRIVGRQANVAVAGEVPGRVDGVANERFACQWEEGLRS